MENEWYEEDTFETVYVDRDLNGALSDGSGSAPEEF